MELFDINKKVFEFNGWDEVSNLDKKKNFFMLHRFFSIGHPLQANILQHLKINQAATIDFWHNFLSYKYSGKVPSWIFTKGAKKSNEEKEKKVNISTDLLKEYCRVNSLDYKTIQDTLMHFPEELSAEIKAFEKIIKQK